MWLVLCSSQDLPALWAGQGLKARGLDPVEIVTADQLACSLRWEHRLGAGGAEVEVTLADGRTLRHDRIRGALNRLQWIPPGVFAASPDREYALQEMTAFFLSWLYGLPDPVLNRPTPQGLSGRWRHASEWIWLAAQAGLPVPPYRKRDLDAEGWTPGERPLFPQGTPMQTVLVLDGETAGAAAPAEILGGCRRLARLAGTSLLGIDFAAGPAGAWTFAGANPTPDLRLGGDRFLDQLAATLRGPEEN
jgi:hypothetical protein